MLDYLVFMFMVLFMLGGMIAIAVAILMWPVWLVVFFL